MHILVHTGYACSIPAPTPPSGPPPPPPDIATLHILQKEEEQNSGVADNGGDISR
jgi:hypothetical protein